MIKYLELTAPEKSEFRQAKILSIEINEGDRVEVGDTLFKVKSGSNKIDLPATKAGVIAEIIALADENISVMTPLVLLETEVEESTATPPLNDYPGNPLTTPAPVDEEQNNTNQQPAEVVIDPANVTSKSNHTTSKSESLVSEKQSEETAANNNKTTEKPKKTKKKSKAKKKSKKKPVKRHQQQSLDLGSGLDLTSEEADDSTQLLQATLSDESEHYDDPNSEQSESLVEQPPEQTDSVLIVNTTPQTAKQTIVINIPDIGTDSAKVVDIFIKPGDQIDVDQSLITLESDKASMDVPSTHAGTVLSIHVELDQDVSEGQAIVELSLVASTSESKTTNTSVDSNTEVEVSKDQATEQSVVQVTVPDIGGDSARVVEILVQVGQTVAVEDSLITLESDKASMDVPSSTDGEIQSIDVVMDQEVSEGTLIITVLNVAANVQASDTQSPAVEQAVTTEAAPSEPTDSQARVAPPTPAASAASGPAGKSHASPSIRRFARELGVQLSSVVGTGRKNRISKGDVKRYVKGILAGGKQASPAASQGAGIPAIPAVDFSKFGEVDIQPLNRIKRLTASNLHRSWLNVPHVTHSDESNISELDDFRKQLNQEYKTQGRPIKLSPLAFIVKAVVNGLQTYPQFNSSLEPGGENLIYKKYIHIGIAVETPNGLVVPVIRDADKKSVSDIAETMAELAGKARDGKLTMTDMSGSCFTISSLGGIGGTHFTPIVNAPEVAILGVSRTKIQPHWNGEEFEPAMMLPLSLSYDHRVIDGAEAARFTRHIASILEDVRRLTV